MKENHLGAPLHKLVLLLIGVCLPLLVPAGLCAQETARLIPIRIETSTEPLAPVNLRPNTLTTVGIVLQNASEDVLRDVTVKVVQILADDEVRVLAMTGVAEIQIKKDARVIFKKAKDAKEGKEAKESPAKVDVAGAPFKVQIWIEAKQPKDFVTIKRDIDLIIREPRDYVTPTAQFNTITKKISFRLKFDDNETLIGPHKCPVQLILGPELEETKKGAFKQLLMGPKQSVDLFAEGIAFTPAKPREGRVYLNVDGYERAFTYKVAILGEGNIGEIPFGKKIGARIRVPRHAAPNAKFPVSLELDGPLDPDYRVEVGLDRAGLKEQFQTVKFTGLRQQKIQLGLAPSGDLYCQTEVRDWQAEFDTTGIFGDIWFRLIVSKKDRKTGKYEDVELTYPEEYRAYVAAMESDVESKQVFARVSQDITQSEDIEFVDLPKEWIVGKSLSVLVKIRKREDPNDAVEKVVFFRGKARADGKINPEAVLGVGEPDTKQEKWSFLLSAPDKSGPLELSVQATTRTGVPLAKTAMIVFKDADGSGAKVLTKIKGIVAHGKTAQPKLTVTLSDDKGKVKAAETSNAKGEFVFEKVAPGTYLLSASTPFPALIGRTVLVVPEGKELIDNVAVRLLAK